jgi:hypothetical protein
MATGAVTRQSDPWAQSPLGVRAGIHSLVVVHQQFETQPRPHALADKTMSLVGCGADAFFA